MSLYTEINNWQTEDTYLPTILQATYYLKYRLSRRKWLQILILLY